jgi:hypothetical protein
MPHARPRESNFRKRSCCLERMVPSQRAGRSRLKVSDSNTGLAALPAWSEPFYSLRSPLDRARKRCSLNNVLVEHEVEKNRR